MQIDIDFEVFKTLTVLRRDERDTLNDVLRRLTKVDTLQDQIVADPTLPASSSGCVFKGVQFPEGTRFRATYKGKTYFGEVKQGQWHDEADNTYNSPSQAAFKIQQSGVNGWNFWECKRPADTEWTLLAKLRDYSA